MNVITPLLMSVAALATSVWPSSRRIHDHRTDWFSKPYLRHWIIYLRGSIFRRVFANSLIIFFEAQPIKGARFYYLRNIMHDWPDDKCVEILAQLIAALGPQSQILNEGMVLLDSGVPWEAATIDLTMMSSLGSRERTLKEWHGVLDRAGLKIVIHIHTYLPRRQDSFIQAMLK